MNFESERPKTNSRRPPTRPSLKGASALPFEENLFGRGLVDLVGLPDYTDRSVMPASSILVASSLPLTRRT